MLEVRIKKEELLKGVSQTQSIAEKRSSMPMLSSVLLEAVDGRLSITATDLEIAFRGTYEAEIVTEGRLTVPARKFYEIIRVFGDDLLTLREQDGFRLVITGIRSNYQLNGLSPDDFPPMPGYDNIQFIRVPAEIMSDMLEKTISSIAVEETRYNLAGVYFEKVETEKKGFLRLVSTDGHRLNFVEKEIVDVLALDLPKGVIVSRKGVSEMRKLTEVGGPLDLGFTHKTAVLKGSDFVLVMRLLDGKFPDYNVVIPKRNDKILTANRKAFLEMIRRVSVMSSDDYKGVKFSLTSKELTLTAVNPDLGEAREGLPVDYDGPDLDIGFNPRYYSEALSAINSDSVSVALYDGGSPSKITAADDVGYIGVIMPMKI